MPDGPVMFTVVRLGVIVVATFALECADVGNGRGSDGLRPSLPGVRRSVSVRDQRDRHGEERCHDENRSGSDADDDDAVTS